MEYNKFSEKYAVDLKIIELRQQGATYKEIADILKKNVSYVMEKYRRFMFRLYIYYCGYLNEIGIEMDIQDIAHFYESISIAYLEKAYEEPLDLLRHGAPPVMYGYYREFPPYRFLTERQKANLEKKVLEEKRQNVSDPDIASKLKITSERVKCIYNLYLNEKILTAIDRIEPTVGYSFKDFIYSYSYYSSVRWKLIVSEYGELVQDLID